MNTKTIKLQSASSTSPSLQRWSLAMLLGGSLLLGGCAEPAAEDATVTEPVVAGGPAEVEEGGACMENIRANGLRVITSPDYPPYEFMNEQNEIDGYEIELVRALADEIGVQAEITGQSFDGLIPSLLAGRADMIAAGMTVTEERQESVAFSDPFSNDRNLILAGSDDTVGDEASLNGKTVAVQTGSVQEIIASEIEGAEVKNFELYTDAALALSNGQVDSMIVDEAAGRNFIAEFPGLREAAQLAEQPKAFAVSKECPDLVAELNAALSTLNGSGRADEIKASWFTQ